MEPVLPTIGEAPRLVNENFKVDVDRGVHFRVSALGMAIYMYVDTPGVFFNEHNRPVTPDFVIESGWPEEEVNRFLKMKRRNDARRKAMQEIDLEFASGGTREIICEEDGYRIVHSGNDMYNLEFEDGSIMNANGPIPLDIATRTFNKLLGRSADATLPSTAEAASQPKTRK